MMWSLNIHCLVLFTMKQAQFLFRDIPLVLARLRGASLILIENWRLPELCMFLCFLIFFLILCIYWVTSILLSRIWWLIRIWIRPSRDDVWHSSQPTTIAAFTPTVRGRAERCDTLQLWKCTSPKNIKNESTKIVLQRIGAWFLKFVRC